MEFRDFHESLDSKMLESISADQEQWDEGLEFPSLPEFFEKWQNPKEADKYYKMELQLMEVKDRILEGLNKVMERGEHLDQLETKAAQIKTDAGGIRKKSKQINQQSFWQRFLGCVGGPCSGVQNNDISRGIQVMKLTRKAKSETDFL